MKYAVASQYNWQIERLDEFSKGLSSDYRVRSYRSFRKSAQMKIGFVVLSHRNPAQLERLVRTLQTQYDNPPIAVHHDFDQSPLSTEIFKGNVHFVIPSLRTLWGQFSVVSAALQCLNLLYQKASPDWFFLLSGADYPTASAATVTTELGNNHADALLDFREIALGHHREKPALNEALKHFSSSENIQVAWRRYIALKFYYPVLRRDLRVGWREIGLPVGAPLAPFSKTFKCFYGDHWFAGNSKTASVLMSPSSEHRKLAIHLRLRHCVDECYYQTVLANTRGLTIDRSTRRFAIWSPRLANPKTLAVEDLPAIQASRAYFARKFDFPSPVLDEVDRMLKLGEL